MAKALSYDDFQAHLLAAAAGARLEIWNVQVLQSLVDLGRILSFSVAPSAWSEPYPRRADIAVEYRAVHSLMASEPERHFEPNDAQIEIDVEYVLLVSEVALAELEATVRPLVTKLGQALGKPQKVYYTVATDYAGTAHAVEAKVLATHGTKILEDAFDGGFFDEVARGLRSLQE
ncbi:MAG TPA: hypothetical protein VFF73_25245 [Planctomycetota bacterium]|nr:hypothetical protein [Planctomycetota bacterium]